MPIQPLQLPRIIDLPKIDFSGLDKIGDAYADYRSRSVLAESLPGVLGTQVSQQGQQPQGNSLPNLGRMPPFVPEAPAAQSQQPKSAGDAISGIESGGRYDALGPVTKTGDQAFGKYQVMGANVGPWTKQYLGRELTPQEFLKSPEAQEAVFKGEFGRLVAAHGPEGAARAWFAGEGGMNDLGRKDQLGTTVGQYGGKFAQATQQPQQIAGARPDAIQPAGGGIPPQTIERLQAMIRAGGQSEKLAMALVQKYVAPQFGFQVVGDKLYRTNQTAGTAEEIAQTNQPKFGVIGKDQNGFDVHGFFDPNTKKVYDIGGRPLDTSKLMGVGGQPNANLTGDEYLKTLDPGRASQVKAIVEGRMAPPSSMALKNPQMVALMRDAAQYEPGFDMTKWTQRNSTVRDFASGKGAQNVTSLNTVIGHLGDLAEKAEALGNYRVPLANTVTNAVSNATGDPRVNNFRLARNAVADEMARVFRSVGMSDHEIQQWKSTLSEDMSPDQLRGAVKTGIGLMESRLSALADQRSRGFDKSMEPRDLLNDKSKATLEKVMKWAEGSPENPADKKPEPAKPPIKVQSYDDVNKSLSNAREAVKSGKWKREDAIKKLIDGGVPPEMANRI